MSDQNNDEVVMWQKLAAESFNLDMPPYPYQYVQDEELVFSKYFCKGWEQLNRNLGKSTETLRKILPKSQISV